MAGPTQPLPARRWYADPLAWAELFALSNVAFLGVDILVAHAVNAFENPWEWAPIAFSAAGSMLLFFAMLLGGLRPAVPGASHPSSTRRQLARALGLLVGYGSIVVGVAGLVFHLRSDFFSDQTIKNLVYTAPFTAPLAYTGVGLLLLLNRMVPPSRLAWAQWILVLAAGGFLGNFVLSLADHAQNGFFNPLEWTGVIAGALAVGILVAVILIPLNRPLARLAWVVMAAQVFVGVWGFLLHVAHNLARPGPGQSQGLLGAAVEVSSSLLVFVQKAYSLPPDAFFSALESSVLARFIFGTPAFAPLLFADIALLSALGLWALERTLNHPAEPRIEPSAALSQR